MIRYIVVYLPSALAELATLWMAAIDKPAVTRASDVIERELREDPDQKGLVVEGQLRCITIEPLIFYYFLEPDDRRATVWSVRIAKNS